MAYCQMTEVFSVPIVFKQTSGKAAPHHISETNVVEY
jgi:hypothetical protein